MPQYADKVTGSQTPVSNFSVKLEPVELMSTCTSDDVQRGGNAVGAGNRIKAPWQTSQPSSCRRVESRPSVRTTASTNNPGGLECGNTDEPQQRTSDSTTTAQTAACITRVTVARESPDAGNPMAFPTETLQRSRSVMRHIISCGP